MLTVGSLFAGIGGFDLGLERTGGFEVRWQCEIDDYCRRVLAKHWPDVKRYGDIRELADVERVDVLCGGFPCQDISNAGKRAGIDGERSGLWSEYVRIIRMVRPRYVLVENVAALLNRGMERVLGELSESGYDAEWDIISASAVGAPHRRERVWIIAYPASDLRRTSRNDRPFTPDGCGPSLADSQHDGLQERWGTEDVGEMSGRPTGIHPDEFAGGLEQEDSPLANATICEPGQPSERERRKSISGGSRDSGRTQDARLETLGHTNLSRMERQWSGREQILSTRYSATQLKGSGYGGGEQWATEPDVGRVAHGVPSRVDRLKGLGNAVVPQIVEWLGNRILEHEARIARCYRPA